MSLFHSSHRAGAHVGLRSWRRVLVVAVTGFALIGSGLGTAPSASASASASAEDARQSEVSATGAIAAQSVTTQSQGASVVTTSESSAAQASDGARAEVLQRQNAEQWTTNSHTWQTAEGTTKVEVFNRPAFGRSADGWEPLSADLEASDGVLSVPGSIRPLQFGAAGSSLVSFALGDEQVEFSAVGATGAPQQRKDVVAFPEALPDTDLEVTPQTDGFALTAVLRSMAANSTVAFEVSDRGHVLGRPRLQKDGSYLFSSVLADGTRLQIGAPTATDAEGDLAPSSAIKMRVTSTKTGYQITKSVDAAWLEKAAFPVTVDPTVTFFPDIPAGYNSDGWIADTSCPYASRVSETGYSPLLADSELRVGGQSAEARSFMWFDLTPWVPSGTPIVSSTLNLRWQHSTSTDTGSHNVRLVEYPKFWQTARNGCSLFWPGAQGTAAVSGSAAGAFPITDTIQRWVNNPETNNGFVILQETLPVTGGPHYGDAYGSSSSAAPWSLTIEYAGPVLPSLSLPASQVAGNPCTCVSVNPTVTRADPVNTGTGRVVESAVDASIPGTPLSVIRSYDSGNTAAGLLGPGWSTNYSTRLDINQATGDATVVLGTGNSVIYARQPDGSFLGAPGSVATLTQTGSGYDLSTTDNRLLSFDSAGLLTRILSRTDGQSATLAYAGGRLSTVTDRDGNRLTFSVNTTSGFLSSVSLPGYGTVSYEYTGSRLSKVTRPDGTSTNYAYDGAGNLAGITDGSGTVANVYGPDGRLTRQTDAEGNVTTFSWDAATQTMTTTMPRGGTWKDTYSGNLVTSSTDPLGHTTRFEYDGNGQLAKVTDASAKATTMSYDARGNMLERIGPGPEYIREAWTYDGGNQVLSHTDGDAKTTTFTYTASEQLASQTDPLGRKTTYFYDSTGRLANVVDPRGNAAGATPANYRTVFSYDAKGYLATVTNPLGETTHTTLDAQGRLLAKTDALGNKTTYTYNNAGQIATVVAARGNASGAIPADFTTRYAYDAAGNLRTITDPLSQVTTRSYDRNNRLTSVTDPRGNATSTTYDADGNVASTTDAAGGVTTYVYDLAGRQTTMVTPRGNALPTGSDLTNYTWTSKYDNVGNQTRVSNPLTGTQTSTFDAYHRVTSASTPYDLQYGYTWATTSAYDGRGHLVSSTTPSGKTTYGYDAAGQLSSVVDPRGNVSGATPATFTTSYGYDFAGNRTSTTDAVGSQSTSAFDAANRLVSSTDARGNVSGATASDYRTSYGYDPAGRLTRITSPLGEITTYGYDPDGNQTTMVDPRGNVTGGVPATYTTTSTYDAAGQLARTDAPAGQTVRYQRDAAGNPLTVTDANNHVTTYAYDRLGRVDSRTSPTGQRWNYNYDRDGNLATVETPIGSATPTTGDGTIGYSYDAVGRRTGIDYSDTTPDVTFTYGTDLRRYTMADTASSNRSFETDWAGRITYAGDAGGVGTFYTYDPAGLMSRFQTSGDVGGITANADLGYDGAGHLTSVATNYGAGTYTLGYDRADHLTTITPPAANGNVETRSYDRDGRLTGVTSKKGTTTLSSFTQAFDVASNPISGTMVSGGTTVNTAYTYDAASRLTKACWTTSCTNSTAYAAYTYDGVGNRLTENRVGIATPGSTTYTYNNADQLTTTKIGTTTTSYGYDLNGNQTTAGARTSIFDLANRLKSTTASGTTTAFTYDGDGNRATTKVGNTTTKQVWNVAGPVPQLALELDSSNKLLSRYTNATGIPLALNTSAGTNTYSHDLQGSISDVTNSSGAKMWTYNYEPFGAARTTTKVNTKAPVNPLRFSGEYLDGTGQYNLRARMYNPALGQFTALDPAVSQTGQAYAYANTNPLRYNDPTGLWSCQTGLFDVCASMEYFGYELVGAGQTAVGVVEAGVMTAVNPVGTIINLYNACAQGVDQYSGDLLAGVAACVDNLNPIAQIRDQLIASINLALAGCLDQSAIQMGGGLFNSGLLAAPFAKPGILASGTTTTEGGVGVLRLSTEESWGNPGSLAQHFRDHGADFGATSAADYARQASIFFQRGLQEGLPTKIDSGGIIRIYDPSTNTFGAFNPDGTTATFFKPTSPTYWDRQPGTSP